MTHEEILSFIHDNLTFYSSLKSYETEMFDYISKVTDTLNPCPSAYKPFYTHYGLVEKLADEFMSFKDGFETAGRALQAIAIASPYEITERMPTRPDKYELYKALGLSADFAFNDAMITAGMLSNNTYRYYMFNVDYEEGRKVFDSAFKYYGKDFAQYLFKFDEYNNKDKLNAAIILLYALQTSEKNRYKEFIPLLAKMIIAGAKAFTDASYLSYIVEEYISSKKGLLSKLTKDSFTPLYESTKADSTVFDSKQNFCSFTISASAINRGIADSLDTAIYLSLLACSPEECGYTFNAKFSLIESIYKRYKMPAEFELSLHNLPLFSHYRSNASMYDKVWKMASDKPQILSKAIKNLFAAKDLHAASLLSIGLKYHLLSNSDETAYIQSMRELFLSILSAETSQIISDDDSVEASASAIISGSGTQNVKLKIKNDFDNLYTAAIVLCDFTQEASNILLCLVNGNIEAGCGYLNPLKMYGMFRKDVNSNIYENLHQYLPTEYIINIHFGTWNQNNDDGNFKEYIKAHSEAAENAILSDRLLNEAAVKYIKFVYGSEEIMLDIKYLCCALARKAKSALNCAEKLLITHEADARTYVEEMTESKQKASRDAAMRLLKAWDNARMEKELSSIEDIQMLTAYVEPLYNKKNDKYIPYSDLYSLKDVRIKGSEDKAPEMLIKYYISEYMLLKDIYIINVCTKIESMVNTIDLKQLLKNIYEHWISEGTSVKYKNILIPYAINMNDGNLLELKKQIDWWSNNSKAAVAAFAVTALAMNKSDLTLFMIDEMSKKHKNKKVKTAAAEALKLAAQLEGVTDDELTDRIIPNLGFNRNREKIFDYGPRQFKCILSADMDISLFSPEGKPIKSLPKISASDDEEMAVVAKDEFKTLKKQIKSVIDSQKLRMEKALISKRSWTVDRWKHIFVDNPIMNVFATTLIWVEIDADGNKLKSFRYMDDGTFNTCAEDECSLEASSSIVLWHPAEADGEESDAWEQQLEDYEIMQPVCQLKAPVYELNEENINKTEIDDVCSKKIYGATVKSIMNKYGLIPEFGSYGDYERGIYVDEKSDVVLILSFGGFSPMDYSAVIELGNITYMSEERTSKLTLGSVPLRLLSLGKMLCNALLEKEVAEN